MNPKDLVGAKKAPLRLVPPAAIIGMADGLSVGAVKYGAFNWRQQPIENVTYVEAAIRHLFAYLDGEEFSDDSEQYVGHPVHHIDHALAGLGILRDALASGELVEARGPSGPAASLLRAMDRSVSPAAAPAPEGRVESVTVTPWYSHGQPDPCPICDSGDIMSVDLVEALERTETAANPKTYEVVAEGWGTGDGPVTAFVDYRGSWPPDTRVAGRLTCCGQTEHPLECPQWR